MFENCISVRLLLVLLCIKLESGGMIILEKNSWTIFDITSG